MVLKYKITVRNSIMCIAKRIQSVMMHINHNESKQHRQLAQRAKVVTHLVQPPVLNRRGGRMISLQGKSGLAILVTWQHFYQCNIQQI